MHYEKAIEALKTVHEALSPLAEDERRRVVAAAMILLGEHPEFFSEWVKP